MIPSLKAWLRIAPFLICAAGARAALPPVAMVQPVTTNYYGTPVTDNYRWMETPDSKPLAAWMKAQNDYTRSFLDAIPGRAALLQAIDQATNSTTETSAPIRAGGEIFYAQIAPGQNTAKLYMRNEITGKAKLLIDPDTFADAGAPAAVNYFQPSQDGNYVAYGVSAGGTEAAMLRVVDTKTGQDMGVTIDRVQGANDEFPPVWWLPDNKSFAYYRMQKLGPNDPATGFFEKSRAYLHTLGANPLGDGDTPLFGYGVDPSIPVGLDQDALVTTVPGSDYAFGELTENEGTDTVDAIYAAPIAGVMAGKPVWTQVAGKDDDITQIDAHGSQIFLLSYRNAPRFQILATDLAAPDLAHPTVVVPQSDQVIKFFGVARDALYVDSTDGGTSKIVRLPFTGASVGAPRPVILPYSGTVHALATNPTALGAIYTLEAWVKPTVFFGYMPGAGTSHNTDIEPPATVYLGDLTSREVEATSYDGTLVPLSIVMKAGTVLDGHNPTLLIGYGSYGLEIPPHFIAEFVPWLQHGGIIAVSHPRGGGWFGKGWHQAGMKLKKLNTVFDFIACAQYLVDHHYTSPSELAGEGGSAGGITVGGAINWRPDLFAAAVDSHGETDELRSEFTPNGPPNIVEFGSVTTEEGFHGLYLMSPYTNVRDGEKYPAVILFTGVNDPRVEPWEVAKMAARLQAATSSSKPVLLSVSYDSSHGIGSTKEQDNDEWADEASFLLWQFGDPAFQPKQH